ncbi:antimicrobial response protein [Lithospermum erythrorhizon]|uniref:Antimicrobial response protein n=1 Tax=Lithospermum erythrorhizon TaxID=34254 RepID=A0AAV3NHD5_LITER
MSMCRYIVVFDDVWSGEAWHALKFAFPDSKCGSRIVLTTRIIEVAQSIDTTAHVYQLYPLPQNESWTLFCMKAFRGKDRGVCPEELKEISRSILKKCEGLPLAIVTIAGLLSQRNMMFTEWKKIHDSVAAEMKTNVSLGNLEKILILSYKDLPYHLKQCYLYLSVFPEDYLIKRTKMVRLWLAERLVEAKPGLTMREVAEDYFNELVGRNMIQVVYKNHFKVQACRVHDLMREIIQMRSAQESFAVILTSRSTLLDEKMRRMSIDLSSKKLLSAMRFPKLRSLLVFIQPGIISLDSAFFHGLKFLRVLELEGATLSVFPMELTRLIHLRYLSLRRTNLSQLPESISELRSLEILDLKHSLVTSMPNGFLKLENLCQLSCYKYHFRSSIYPETLGMTVPTGIGRLTKLQKLNAIDVGKSGSIVTELGYLTKLKRLGILQLKKEQEFDLCCSLEKLKQLTDLMVVPADSSEPFDFNFLSSPPQNLQRLVMKCTLPTFPQWIVSCQYLNKLVLQYSNSSKDPLRVFQVLNNLVELDLREAYRGEELCCDPGGYPLLKKLSIADMQSLRYVNVEKGSMCSLKELILVSCENLGKVPVGIEHLGDLQDLLIVAMPPSFLIRLDGPHGEDFEKVKHIPTVKVFR